MSGRATVDYLSSSPHDARKYSRLGVLWLPWRCQASVDFSVRHNAGASKGAAKLTACVTQLLYAAFATPLLHVECVTVPLYVACVTCSIFGNY